MSTVAVKSKASYGYARMYPANRTAEKLAQRLKRKTLDVGNLEDAVKTGATVKHVGAYANIWIERAFQRYTETGSFA